MSGGGGRPEDWNDHASKLTAILSTSLFIITGLASLPSVGRAMNKSQFMFVFGPVVWLALAFGTMHFMFLGVESWTADPRSPRAWSRGMPPVTLMASLIPLLVMFIKAVQVILLWVVQMKEVVNRRKAQVAPSMHASDSDHLFVIDEEV